jgi:hypothetical protein
MVEPLYGPSPRQRAVVRDRYARIHKKKQKTKQAPPQTKQAPPRRPAAHRGAPSVLTAPDICVGQGCGRQ